MAARSSLGIFRKNAGFAEVFAATRIPALPDTCLEKCARAFDTQDATSADANYSLGTGQFGFT
jgi:hypothetical protein